MKYILAGMIFGTAASAAAQVRVDERVDVRSVLVDARVADRSGRPIHGLTADDFHVEIDGRPVGIDWVQWVGTGEVEAAGAGQDVPVGPADGARASTPAAPPSTQGRLLVFLFQKDLTHGRVEGMLRMMRESAAFVDRLGPNDRAAVVVFDSRLHIWQDFTNDRARLSSVLSGGILSAPPRTATSEGVSLAAVADAGAFRRAGRPERALEALAAALGRIQGAKSLVLFGYGFGEYRPVPGYVLGRTELDDAYLSAREALTAARVAVFALDITQADEHTLETSLMTVAEETGGFYARTDRFPASAMKRLGHALEGYYVLAVDASAVKPRRPEHEIDVGVRMPGAVVTARRYYRE